jgi:serine/threonine-protein kinase
MSLSPGARIGGYEVTGAIGAGGMGQVYRAHDRRLGRDVAIKILPDMFLADTDRVQRFEREARTLAALNHPNIAQIYGMEDRALVMELVEGDDLSVVMSRGPVPIADALPIARQIAAALEAAHEQGIIHRDLKPANIKLNPDGVVKVLDFGLAKAMGTDGSGAVSASLANSPTMTSPATELGLILGTAAYMSPEQARGKPVDRRADVWAFGVVLFEMLTGRRAFTGSEVSDVLASVLKDSIPLDTLPPDTPVPVRRLLRRCLQKDRAQRLDSMAAARLEIAEAMSAAPDEDRARTIVAAPSRSPWRIVSGVLALALVVLAAPAASSWWRPAPAPVGRVIRFTVPIKGEFGADNVGITPDGATIVYETDRLYARSLADVDARALPGTEGAQKFVVSPSGRWVLFYADEKIKKVALSGGDPLTVCAAPADGPGAGWGPDNTIIFSPGWNSPLYSVSADGGTPKVISTLNAAAGEIGHWHPQTLPDQKTVLFTTWMAGSGINDSRIALLDVATGKHRVLMPGALARYAPSGHLVYFYAGEYHAVRFDPVTLTTSGDSIKTLPDARPFHPLGTWQETWAVSSDGTLAYLSGPLYRQRTLSWVTPAGVVEPTRLPARMFRDLGLSPDGRRVIATEALGGTETIYLYDLVRGSEEKLDLPPSNFGSHWSPSGDFFAFTGNRTGHFDVYLYRFAEGREEPFITDPFDQEVRGVTHDGKQLLILEYLKDGSSFLSAANVDRSGTRRRIRAAVNFDDIYLSPDDKWIAVSVIKSGRSDVTVFPFDGAGSAVTVSSRGGTEPIWSKTSQKLFYRRDSDLIAATYTTAGGRFVVEREETLFKLPQFDVLGLGPDGRFLVAIETPGQVREVRVATNWFEELKK